MAGEEVDLGRGVTVEHDVVDEEVMQLVRTDQILGLLLDLSLGIRRHKFRTDRRFHNVDQDL